METCSFISWIGRCENPAVENGLCEEHKNLKCSLCGKQATRECDRVCGCSLCKECDHFMVLMADFATL